MVIELSRSQKTLCQGHQCICKKKTNNVNMADLQKLMDAPQSPVERNKANSSVGCPL